MKNKIFIIHLQHCLCCFHLTLTVFPYKSFSFTCVRLVMAGFGGGLWGGSGMLLLVRGGAKVGV